MTQKNDSITVFYPRTGNTKYYSRASLTELTANASTQSVDAAAFIASLLDPFKRRYMKWTTEKELTMIKALADAEIPSEDGTEHLETRDVQLIDTEEIQ